jgi:SagB-type dehydrogenase family enzyme
VEPAADRPDVGFDAVLRARRSIREHAEQAVALSQVGELLYRSARFTSLQRVDGDEVVSRPYPGGGALHKLELYLVVDRCVGLEPGVYHYRAADHQLEQVSDPCEASEALLRDAGYSMGTGRSPQVLVVVAARFPRLSWKYQSIAYSLVLKHVGCLVQTLYLVATSMGLAPCGIGGGDSAQLARLLPGSPYLETSVGELALGVPAPGARTLPDS